MFSFGVFVTEFFLNVDSSVFLLLTLYPTWKDLDLTSIQLSFITLYSKAKP